MKLLELIKIDNRFEKSVNLTLDLYVQDKIDGYIPTRSSVNILDSYINEVRSFSGNRATVLIGPYGKGKSHLLLVLLSILSRTCQMSAINKLVQRIFAVNPDAAAHISDVMENQGQFLTVLINANGNNSLNQAFMRALTSALTRDGLADVIPDNYYTESVKMLQNWKQNFPDTYKSFQEKLNGNEIDSFVKKLESYDEKALEFFRAVYPELTSGGVFNPLIDDEVISVYQSVNRILREKYGYAGIYIIFDEFSKYIEGHAVEGFAGDMKVLQDMPKIQIITDEKSIEKYGGSRMYFAPPLDYDRVMRQVPEGKVITVGELREYFARQNQADFTDPITAGIFVSICAWASFQRSTDETPYWRTLKANGELNPKYPGGTEAQKVKLEAEGHTIIQKDRTNIRYFVKDYEAVRFELF